MAPLPAADGASDVSMPSTLTLGPPALPLAGGDGAPAGAAAELERPRRRARWGSRASHGSFGVDSAAASAMEHAGGHGGGAGENGSARSGGARAQHSRRRSRSTELRPPDALSRSASGAALRAARGGSASGEMGGDGGGGESGVDLLSRFLHDHARSLPCASGGTGEWAAGEGGSEPSARAAAAGQGGLQQRVAVEPAVLTPPPFLPALRTTGSAAAAVGEPHSADTPRLLPRRTSMDTPQSPPQMQPVAASEPQQLQAPPPQPVGAQAGWASGGPRAPAAYFIEPAVSLASGISAAAPASSAERALAEAADAAGAPVFAAASLAAPSHADRPGDAPLCPAQLPSRFPGPLDPAAEAALRELARSQDVFRRISFEVSGVVAPAAAAAGAGAGEAATGAAAPHGRHGSLTSAISGVSPSPSGELSGEVGAAAGGGADVDPRGAREGDGSFRFVAPSLQPRAHVRHIGRGGGGAGGAAACGARAARPWHAADLYGGTPTVDSGDAAAHEEIPVGHDAMAFASDRSARERGAEAEAGAADRACLRAPRGPAAVAAPAPAQGSPLHPALGGVGAVPEAARRRSSPPLRARPGSGGRAVAGSQQQMQPDPSSPDGHAAAGMTSASPPQHAQAAQMAARFSGKPPDVARAARPPPPPLQMPQPDWAFEDLDMAASAHTGRGPASMTGSTRGPDALGGGGGRESARGEWRPQRSVRPDPPEAAGDTRPGSPPSHDSAAGRRARAPQPAAAGPQQPSQPAALNHAGAAHGQRRGSGAGGAQRAGGILRTGSVTSAVSHATHKARSRLGTRTIQTCRRLSSRRRYPYSQGEQCAQATCGPCSSPRRSTGTLCLPPPAPHLTRHALCLKSPRVPWPPRRACPSWQTSRRGRPSSRTRHARGPAGRSGAATAPRPPTMTARMRRTRSCATAAARSGRTRAARAAAARRPARWRRACSTAAARGWAARARAAGLCKKLP
jgi:hypothetical protein